MIMALLSPGVEIKEIDASTIVPTVSDSIGVFCGEFYKGPLNHRVLITNPDDLVEIFGTPTDRTYNQFFQAYNFLQYQNTMYVVRQGNTEGSSDSNYIPYMSQTSNSSDDILVQNSHDFEMNQNSFYSKIDEEMPFMFIASTPGDWGNDIEVQVQKASDFKQGKYQFDGILLDSLFEYFPDEELDEFQIVVKHENDIEAFLVSNRKDALDTRNKNIYFETLINRDSNLVYVVADAGFSGTNKEPKTIDFESKLFEKDGQGNILNSPMLFSGGVQGQGGLKSALLDAYELFDNVEELDVDIIIGNEEDDGRSAINLAMSRKDCIAFYGQPEEACVGKKNANQAVQDVIAWRESPEFNHNTMFACVQGNYKYQYDRYNDKNRWVNLQGDIQGLRAQTNTNQASWWASAGLDRGQIKNVLKLQFIPNMPQRDALYKNSLNPVTTFPGMGSVMWGQKTLQTKPSSFDRVNVRGLFNTIERALAKMSRYQVFEFNDEFTRNRITQMVRPFLETVQAGRGIQEFLVICDETNNTPDIISRNQLIVDIYIKPTYVAEFITLRFTNAGVNDFSTIVS